MFLFFDNYLVVLQFVETMTTVNLKGVDEFDVEFLQKLYNV